MKQDPIRTCAGCGTKKRKQDLIRFAFRNGRIFIDNTSEYGGRGWYVCYNISCAGKLTGKGRLKGAGSVSDNEFQRFLKRLRTGGYILNVKENESS